MRFSEMTRSELIAEREATLAAAWAATEDTRHRDPSRMKRRAVRRYERAMARMRVINAYLR